MEGKELEAIVSRRMDVERVFTGQEVSENSKVLGTCMRKREDEEVVIELDRRK